jgi:hypothetical protein
MWMSGALEWLGSPHDPGRGEKIGQISRVVRVQVSQKHRIHPRWSSHQRRDAHDYASAGIN